MGRCMGQSSLSPKLSLTIDKALRDEIAEFSLDWGKKYFVINTAGPGRRFCNILLHRHLDLSSKLNAFASEAFNAIGLTRTSDEPRYGVFIGVNSTCAFVHNHYDEDAENGDMHVRLNFMIQKPESGGVPYVDETHIDINEGESWINFASKWKHGSTPVIGKRERIVLSCGRMVNKEDAVKLMKEFNHERI